MSKKEIQIINDKLTQWYNANLDKNAATSVEKKAAKDVELLLKDAKEEHVFVLSNSMTLRAGEYTEETTCIDPKKLFELYPEEFWKLVTIAETNAKAMIGDKGVTKCSIPVEVTKFKIKKDKTKGS